MRREFYRRGQAMVEFVMLALIAVLALSLPWLDGRSPADLLQQAIVGGATSINSWLIWF